MRELSERKVLRARSVAATPLVWLANVDQQGALGLPLLGIAR